MPELKRSTGISLRDSVYLGKGRALTIRGYDTDGNFVCRVEVSNAGVAVFSGAKGGKRLCNLTWEDLVKRLAE